MSMIKGEIDIKGVKFGFVRRRYGKKMFTWLHWRNEDDQWTEYKGDPWPSITIPRKDLEQIADELKAQYDPDSEMREYMESMRTGTAPNDPEGSIHE